MPHNNETKKYINTQQIEIKTEEIMDETQTYCDNNCNISDFNNLTKHTESLYRSKHHT
jgi:hypothetical protein